MHDEPPRWLSETVAQHTPRFSYRWDDLVCNACTSEEGMVSWTPDHLTRKIHERLGAAIESLYATT